MDRLPGSSRKPSKVTPGAHAPDEHALVECVSRHPHPVTKHGASSKGAAWIHGDHAHRPASLADHPDQGIDESALSAAGGARNTDEMSPSSVCLQLRHQGRRLRVSILGQADGSCQGANVPSQEITGQIHL